MHKRLNLEEVWSKTVVSKWTFIFFPIWSKKHRLGELSFVHVNWLMCAMILEHCYSQMNSTWCEYRSMYDMIENVVGLMWVQSLLCLIWFGREGFGTRLLFRVKFYILVFKCDENLFIRYYSWCILNGTGWIGYWHEFWLFSCAIRGEPL